MSRLRRIFPALWLAAALFLGQQAAALHDLQHAIDRIEGQVQHPGPDTCDKCSAFAQFSGAAPAHILALVAVSLATLAASFRFTPAQSRTVVSSRSRAPPSLL
jgi:hypothetical protein